MPERPICTLRATLLIAASLASAAQSSVTVHGGPAYVAGAGGYLSPTLAYAPGASAGNALGAGNAVRRDANGSDLGVRALRWDAAGNVAELNDAGGGGSFAFATNVSGVIVGYASGDVAGGSIPAAVMWNASATVATELGNINAQRLGASTAHAINASGLIAGFGERYDDLAANRGPRAVRWSADGSATMLDAISDEGAGAVAAAGYAINASGTIAGSGTKGNGVRGERAIRWAAGGTVATELGIINADVTDASNASAVAINDAGTAVGYANKFTLDREGFLGNRAVRWDADRTDATELGTLGLDSTGSGDASAYDVNSGGTIVGISTSYDAQGQSLGARATRWNAGEIDATELDGLGGVTIASEAFAINDAGYAVGYVDLDGFSGNDRRRRAVLWGEDGSAYDLNASVAPLSGWTLTSAVGITDAGWITGIGSFDADGPGPAQPYDRLYLLALPEPTTGTALVAAMTMLTLRRRASV